MAELADAEKDLISHRGAGVAELLRWLTRTGDSRRNARSGARMAVR